MEQQTAQIVKRKKFLLVLPLLVLPFITMAFWKLGGGKGTTDQVVAGHEGINKELPGAQLESGTLDKMSLYGKSALDSAGQQGLDSGKLVLGPDSTGVFSMDSPYGGYGPVGYGGQGYGDPNEQKVRQRLEELERIMSMQNNMSAPDFSQQYNSNPYGASDGSVGRLEQMMGQMAGPAEPDQELQVLDGMLEKIMDIQNPERSREKLRAASLENRGVVYAVTRQARSNEVAYMKRDENEAETESSQKATDFQMENSSETNGFYHIGNGSREQNKEMSAIPAVIHESQTVTSGSNIKMRLTEDIYINGIMIPAGQFITGTCTMNGERLSVAISGIRYGNFLLPVRLSVFDLDGVEGIRIPGAISRDVAKESSENAIQSMQFMSMDPSIGAQAAGAGIEAAKSLFSKKVKLTKVTVKAGHPVLLYDQQSNKQ